MQIWSICQEIKHLGFLKMCRKLYLTCNGVHVAAILYYLVWENNVLK